MLHDLRQMERVNASCIFPPCKSLKLRVRVKAEPHEYQIRAVEALQKLRRSGEGALVLVLNFLRSLRFRPLGCMLRDVVGFLCLVRVFGVWGVEDKAISTHRDDRIHAASTKTNGALKESSPIAPLLSPKPTLNPKPYTPRPPNPDPLPTNIKSFNLALKNPRNLAHPQQPCGIKASKEPFKRAPKST